MYAIDDDQNALTHYSYDSGRFVVSQVMMRIMMMGTMVAESCRRIDQIDHDLDYLKAI